MYIEEGEGGCILFPRKRVIMTPFRCTMELHCAGSMSDFTFNFLFVNTLEGIRAAGVRNDRRNLGEIMLENRF